MDTLIYTLTGILLIILMWKLLIQKRKQTPWSTNDSSYDIFISYNTQSSIKVRRIVDYLLANNVKVWFAEYMIPINSQYNEEQFRGKYLEAIKKSKICLIFKNKHYSGSKYCIEEYEKINITHKITDIITLLMQEEDQSPELINVIKYNYNLKHLFKIVSRKLGKTLQLPTNDSLYFQGDFYDFNHLKHVFLLERTGWVRTSKNTSYLKVDKDDTVGPQFIRFFEGVKVELQFSVGRDSQSSVRYNKDELFIDDRSFRKEMINWVQEHFSKRPNLKLTGIHLFFLNEKSHNVFTYFNRNSWTRRYSIIDYYPKWPDKNFEIVLVFSIYGNFQKYCAIAPYLDRMVETMNYYEITK